MTAWIREGHRQKIGIDKLTARTWGVDSAKAETTRKRRERMRDTLVSIGELPGWTVEIDGRGEKAMADIHRSLSKALL